MTNSICASAVLIWTMLSCSGAAAQELDSAVHLDSGNFYMGEASLVLVGEHAGLPALTKSDAVLIKDFVVPAGVITLDNSLAARWHRHHLKRRGEDEDSTPEILARHVQAAFSASLGNELEKLHITSSVAGNTTGGEGASELMISGEFVAIDEGDESARILIGLGHGASKIKAHVTISALSGDRASVIMECNLDAQSGKKLGALIGSSSSVVSSSAGKALGDKKSKVEADATRLGRLLAQQVASLMDGQAAAVVMVGNGAP